MNLPSGWELILVLLVIVVVFGSKRLPESARSLGRSMRILKAETRGLHDDDTPASTPAVTAGSPVLPTVGPVQVQQPVTHPVVAGSGSVPVSPDGPARPGPSIEQQRQP